MDTKALRMEIHQDEDITDKMAILKIIQHNVLAWTYLRRNELFNMYQQ